MSAPFQRNSPIAFAGHAQAVTPSDSTSFDPPAAYLWAGGAGTVVVDTPGGETDVSFTVPAGTYVLVQATKVKAASTATNVVRHW